MESAEQVFLRYAFPCAQVLVDQEKITREEYEFLHSRVISNKPVRKARLEELFKAAVRRIQKVYGEGYWNKDNIRNYFLIHHNAFIEQGEGDFEYVSETLRKLCRVRKGRIKAKDGHVITVDHDGEEKKVMGHLIPEARRGDLISTHLGFAVEVLPK